MSKAPIADRIRDRMEQLGLSKAEVSRRSGISRVYLTDLFKGKSQEPRRSNIEKIAQVLECSLADLYNDESVKKDISSSALDMAFPKEKHLAATYGLINVPEYKIEASAGDGAVVPEEQSLSRMWTIPKQALLAYTSHPESIRLIQVKGDSMEPDYCSGECVMVDISDNVVMTDGVYLLWNGMGLVLKQLQVLPGENGEPILRVSSKNTQYSAYDLNFKDAIIHGRVVAKWIGK